MSSTMEIAPDMLECRSSEYLIALRDKSLPTAPVVEVPIAALRLTRTPRLAGEDSEYTHELAEKETRLPPILVHRGTMSVIDGLHRLRAAELRGQDRIEVRFFDGVEAEADLLAVATNIVHGKPLSTEDRMAAAGRVIASQPQWSDRAVAVVVGMSARRVAQIRRQMSGDVSASDHRIGLDGRARPLDATRGREVAGALIKADPSASLRTIARQAGISPATVADVRNRIMRGDDPVPPKLRGITPGPNGTPESRERAAERFLNAVQSPEELLDVFSSLRRDPSLRFNDSGRTILRLLDVCAMVARERQTILASVPAHCRVPMATLMNGYADLWRSLGDELSGEQAVDGADGF
ncbi:ParB N-terminal domain-containing protein [Streptomyces sp. NPDC050610]|uniref:ParB/RepB/Spo0J family partition protein n=1 Tax=Streptomyces sp. NPDC050610 TaxID=3157097 RepID=UPI003421D547